VTAMIKLNDAARSCSVENIAAFGSVIK